MDNLNSIKKACFTGYRPLKFPFRLNKNNEQYNYLLESLTETLIKLIEKGCSVFYCGIVLSLKKKYKNLRLVCVIPFLEHNKAVKNDWKKRYDKVIFNCDEIVYSSDEYQISAFQIRNIYMVDHSDIVITWYDGQKGGTKNTLTYAQKEGKNIINLNKEYSKEFKNLQNRIDFT